MKKLKHVKKTKAEKYSQSLLNLQYDIALCSLYAETKGH